MSTAVFEGVSVVSRDEDVAELRVMVEHFYVGMMTTSSISDDIAEMFRAKYSEQNIAVIPNDELKMLLNEKRPMYEAEVARGAQMLKTITQFAEERGSKANLGSVASSASD